MLPSPRARSFPAAKPIARALRRSPSMHEVAACVGFLTLLALPVPLARTAPPAHAASTSAPRRSIEKVMSDPIPREARAGRVGAVIRGEDDRVLLSGTLLRQSAATTTYFLYPGACVARALGVWAPRSTPVADSLQNETPQFPHSTGYTDNQPEPGNNTIAYTRQDRSLSETLWNVLDASTPAAERPAILDGNRSLWCGKFDAAWPVTIGYPNQTFQILYVDTGSHLASYTLTFQGNISAERNNDFLTILGGGSEGTPDHADPLTNRRDYMGGMLPPVGTGQGGPNGDSQQLITFTGSITSSQSQTANTTDGLAVVEGASSGAPATVSFALTSVPANHRALYFVFESSPDNSSEDGLWPSGAGVVIDQIAVSDNGTIYSEQVSFASTNDPGSSGISDYDPYGGTVLVWSGATIPQPGDDFPVPIVSARVPAGVGELWQLAPGTENVTSDFCAPQKTFATDLFFEGGDPSTNLSINRQFNSIVSCTFPIPPGIASVFALWGMYLDLPAGSGFVQYVEYRIHKNGAWSAWRNTDAGGAVVTGALQSWTTDGDELAEAVQADSVQLRYNLECVPAFSADGANCSSGLTNALLYDDLRLQVTTGTPAPVFNIFPGAVAQTTFVDGTIDGMNCTINPCWPGIRGSDLGTPLGHDIAIHDNWNSPLGDSITLSILSGLRSNGMGINWRYGFSKGIQAGELGPGPALVNVASPGDGAYYAYENGAHNPAADVPRMIFRLYDPATWTWSPWDSTELVANAVTISDPDGPGGAPPETTLVDSEFNMNWPPYDKSVVNATLPGGFTINGINTYNGIRFLPRGTRMQYYFKAVDINGGVTYQFSTDALAREVLVDLPMLPGSSVRAPDIIEFDVLPGVYPPGSPGSQLAGRTGTPLLNLDAAYTTWTHHLDPVTYTFRSLGVRADRYRVLQGGPLGAGIGGHEAPAELPARRTNYFPNYDEYPLVDSLEVWYQMMVISSHIKTSSILEESDAKTLLDWSMRPTAGEGDRCLFASGNDFFHSLLNATTPSPYKIALAQSAFGVSSVLNSWSGHSSVANPEIDDRFAAPNAGPDLAPPFSFTYGLRGSCPFRDRFDQPTKLGSPDIKYGGYFTPTTTPLSILRMVELDPVGDWDRLKTLGYGGSLELFRAPVTENDVLNVFLGITAPVLFQFLKSCFTIRTGPDTLTCWPCPTTGSWSTNWSLYYHRMYPVQDPATATAVTIPDLPGAPAPAVNRVEGNFPNPFNPATTIRLRAARPGKVVVRILNVAGQVVRTYTLHVPSPGPVDVPWDGQSARGAPLASGVYFYRVRFEDGFEDSKKMILLK